jgi:hypothetical protein
VLQTIVIIPLKSCPLKNSLLFEQPGELTGKYFSIMPALKLINGYPLRTYIYIYIYMCCVCVYIYIIYIVVPELELRAYTLSHSTSPFLGDGACADFEPRSSWSLPHDDKCEPQASGLYFLLY